MSEIVQHVHVCKNTNEVGSTYFRISNISDCVIFDLFSNNIFTNYQLKVLIIFLKTDRSTTTVYANESKAAFSLKIFVLNLFLHSCLHAYCYMYKVVLRL